MFKTIIYTAFGWLTLGGGLHFTIDVLSQYLRGKREPSPETTLYYGLHSAFALGQVAFGIMGLYVAWRAFDVLKETPILLLAALAGLGWLLIAFLFIEYWEPKLVVGIFCFFILSAFVVR